ncbi:beta-eliminating lyase [Hypomontagnella monticulosa]|nr:beta-eliminating lyase [Hypomontagnella monticulosa]
MAQVPLPPSHNAVVVRPLLDVTVKEREEVLKDVEYNVFAFPAGLVTCDFLSDSGTSAMTDIQWATLMRGDESYGRNWGYYCLLDTFRDIFERGNKQERVFESVLTGKADSAFYRQKLLVPHKDGFANGGPHQLERPNFFIVPQGRCAETLLFSTLRDITAEEKVPRRAIVSNGFFDTTGANAAVAGFSLHMFTQPGLSDPFPHNLIGKENYFKGNLDVAATETFLEQNSGQVAMILMTITNNWAAAQPVSMANIKEAAALARRKDVPLFFDACRFAENAMFIHQYEKGYSDKTIAEIVQEMFSYADGFTISLKKDGLSNMGGVLCFRDKGPFARRYEGVGVWLKERQILMYGNDSYGGMSGRDLMTSVAGLYEVTKKQYLRNRIAQVQSFAQKLLANGIAVLSPPGGHAVYLDMDEFFHDCDRKPGDFASVGFTMELIKDYGIRAAETGPFCWEWDKKSPEERKKIPNLVRFAVPRHVFSAEHIDYTVAAIKDLHNRRHVIPNVEIMRGKDMRLRHFQCGMKPVPVDTTVNASYIAVEQDEAEKKQLLDAFFLAAGEWGKSTILTALDISKWVSKISNDNSSYEFSKIASTSRDVFMPPQAEDILVAGHSCAPSKTGPEWKMYLNPHASGRDNAPKVTQEAFGCLGFENTWGADRKRGGASDFITYFALDLSSRQQDARVKVYFALLDVSAFDIVKRYFRLCPDTSTYKIERLCTTLDNDSLGLSTSKPLLSWFAFTSKQPDQAVATAHFPIDACVAYDAEAQRRIEKYIAGIPASDIYLEKYRRIISAVQCRPLARGRGITLG